MIDRRSALWRLAALWPAAAGAGAFTSACNGSPAPAPPPSPAPGGSAGALQVSVLHSALASPWGLAFLPDGRLLVTQKGGSMLLLSADGSRTLATVSGLPAVVAAGQGGLLDVALDPDFGSDPWVYWAYSEPANAAGGGTPGTSGTAVARGRLVGAALQDVAVIFRQTPKRSGGGHFGARLVFRPDKTLFVTLGDRQADNPAAPGLQYAQNLATTLGKVVRIARDGSIPADNPVFSAVDGVAAAPGLWSIGHRNPQGAALQPDTGELWLVEHGPQGGDELNRALPGRNYGWPLRSYGCPYGAPVGEACQVAGGRHAPEFEEPVSTWLPTSIAPSGLVFCKSAQFPQWDGNVLLGALAGTALWRVALGGSGDAVREVGRERLLGDLGQRLRCVKQGPDGWFYLLTDSGRLLRLSRT